MVIIFFCVHMFFKNRRIVFVYRKTIFSGRLAVQLTNLRLDGTNFSRAMRHIILATNCEFHQYLFVRSAPSYPDERRRGLPLPHLHSSLDGFCPNTPVWRFVMCKSRILEKGKRKKKLVKKNTATYNCLSNLVVFRGKPWRARTDDATIKFSEIQIA